MGIGHWFSTLLGGGKRRGNPLVARKCPRCGFWTHRLGSVDRSKFYFWLPRDIGDGIGRTGSEEEQGQKRMAFGSLWSQGVAKAHLGGGRYVSVPLQSMGYFDDYSATTCPVCETPYTEWSNVHVVCKKCRQHVRVFDDKQLLIRCPSCGIVNHVDGVAFEPATQSS
jgi:hypothetical protein